MPAPIPAGLALLALAFNPGWPVADPELGPEALARPERMPDDPEYRPGVTGLCSGQHELYAFTPACARAIAPEARGLGSGVHADRAWLWTIGRPEVVIAVVSGGFDVAHPDLVNRIALNPGELPAPITSTAGPSKHDLNGDGIFNVQDYTSATGTIAPTLDRVRDQRLLARTDLGDTNQNGILDPEDLIAVFGDGVDTDGNGYVDDVAGWDFVGDDASPLALDDDGGTLARWAAASANNGVGGVGACPGCSLLPIRAGVRGLGSAEALALSIAHAVDAGARVVVTDLAVAAPSALLDAALDYAENAHVLVVASAGTASGRERAGPWSADRVLVVGAVGYDRADRTQATSVAAPDPCSGYGPHLDVVAPGRCDARAAGIAAGVAGLAYSVSLGLPGRGVPALERPLYSGEALSLLTGTAEDLASPIPAGAKPGFDEHTAYGRIHARRAIEAVIRGQIPPPARLSAPQPYEVVDADKALRIRIAGEVANLRFERVSWQLEAARGVEPDPASFVAIADGTLVGEGSTRVTGDLDASAFFKDPTAAVQNIGDFAITIRLITSAVSGGDVLTGRTRRVIFVHRDLELFPAFPVRFDAGAVGGARVVDLDDDGTASIAFATSDGRIHLIDATSSARPGFPGQAPGLEWLDPNSPRSHVDAIAFASGALPASAAEPILGALSIARANETGDGRVLIAALTAAGTLLALDASGQAREGFPIRLRPSDLSAPHHNATAPVIYDLNSDGRLELIAADAGLLHVRTLDGESWPGYPVALGEDVGTPAVGDLDLDGAIELVVASATRLWILQASTGTALDGSPHIISDGAFAPRGLDALYAPSPVLVDTNDDGRLDIVLAVPGAPVRVFALGREDPLLEVTTERATFAPRSDAPLAGEPVVSRGGHVTVASPRRGGPPFVFASATSKAELRGLSPEATPESVVTAHALENGTFAIGFPRVASELPRLEGAAVDVDGDRRPELLASDGAYRLRAYTADGTSPPLWPKLTGTSVMSPVSAADLDGDGRWDVVAVTRSGWVYAWRTSGPADTAVAWNGHHHDRWSTGNVSTPTGESGRAANGDGCGCRTSGESGGEALIWGLGGLGWWRRRRCARRSVATLRRRARPLSAMQLASSGGSLRSRDRSA